MTVKTSESTDRILEIFKETISRRTIDDTVKEELLRYETDPGISPMDRYNLAEIHRMAGDHHRAIRNFEGTLEMLVPGSAEYDTRFVVHAKIGEGYYMLAQNLSVDGKLSEAGVFYRKAVSSYEKAMEGHKYILPQFLPVILCQMAVSYTNLGDAEEAYRACVLYEASPSIHAYAAPLVRRTFEKVFAAVQTKIRPQGSA